MILFNPIKRKGYLNLNLSKRSTLGITREFSCLFWGRGKYEVLTYIEFGKRHQYARLATGGGVWKRK